MRKALLIPVVVLLLSIVSLSPISVSAQEPPEEFIKECMPDFGQHSSCWCWVGAAANSFYWWKYSGGKTDLYPCTWDWGPAGPMQNPVDPDSTDPTLDGKDNDQDGAFDEDPYDGIDNDLDGMIDEDGNDWYDDMDDWGFGIDGLDNDQNLVVDDEPWAYWPGRDNDGDGLVDEDPVDGFDNDGDTLVDEDGTKFQPNPGYHPLLKKIAGATFRDINQNGIQDPGEKNYIYSQPVYKWDYVLGLYYFIESIGADLIVHDKIDPNPPGPGIYEPYPGDGPGGRGCQADPIPRGITPANAPILQALGIIVEFSNITLKQFKEQIWHCHDCLLWLRRADGSGPFDHVVTGVGYNQTTVPVPTIYYSDPWTHATVPPHDDNCQLPPNLPDHNKDPRHNPSPYNTGLVIKEDPLQFEDEDGIVWQVINMIKIYQPPPPVGGVWVPVDKLALLAPYIALASAILIATFATAIYVKRTKRIKKQ